MYRQERRRKNNDKPDDFVTYEDSDSEEETPHQQNEVLNTSFNFVDYIRSRESNLKEVKSYNNFKLGLPKTYYHVSFYRFGLLIIHTLVDTFLHTICSKKLQLI